MDKQTSLRIWRNISTILLGICIAIGAADLLLLGTLLNDLSLEYGLIPLGILVSAIILIPLENRYVEPKEMTWNIFESVGGLILPYILVKISWFAVVEGTVPWDILGITIDTALVSGAFVAPLALIGFTIGRLGRTSAKNE